MMLLSPLEAYQRAIDEQGFVADQAQLQAARALQQCQQDLAAPPRRTSAVPGVYLWGPVGRGKTWLMDQFHRGLQVPARRQHFHHFMRWVHARLFQLTGTANPIQALVRELGREVRVLCIDELFISDIGDVMILGPLLQALFQEGVVLVLTSNQPPEQLYAEGYNRNQLLPAIAAINRCMQVVSVDGGQDHRLHPGAAHPRYWIGVPGQPSALREVFARLTAGQAISSEPLTLGHRTLVVKQRSPCVLCCSYAALCEQPLAAADFIQLCDRFSAILLSEVPRLGGVQREAKIARGTEDGVERVAAGDRQLPMLAAHDDGVRRFIALVDECYDRRVPLYLEAEVALTELYTEGYLAFAFRRTLSRLHEMQLQRFGQS